MGVLSEFDNIVSEPYHQRLKKRQEDTGKRLLVVLVSMFPKK